ncbi:hypothetical protein BZM26_36815 [Paraburkholderia strydomiana]|nr:hypothetical protein BZM26_36815 [Paraburkholderia strydomiana]
MRRPAGDGGPDARKGLGEKAVRFQEFVCTQELFSNEVRRKEHHRQRFTDRSKLIHNGDCIECACLSHQIYKRLLPHLPPDLIAINTRSIWPDR